MNTFPILLGALCVYALAYRYYSAFLAAKALTLDDRRTTPKWRTSSWCIPTSAFPRSRSS